MLLTALCLAAAALLATGCVTRGMLRRAEARGPRDADGVLRVARARTLNAAPPSGAPATSATTQAVLFIHGFVGSGGDFADLPDRMAARGLTVRVMRLPGHGTTPQDFARQTTATLLDAVRAEYAALRRTHARVSVVGFSLGGALGTLLASEADVHRLVLCAPYYGVTYRWFYGLPPEAWHACMGWAVPYVPKSKAFVQVNRPEARGQIFSYDCVPTRGVAVLIELGRRTRQPAVLRRVTCPVLMLASAGDQASCPAREREAFARLGSADKQEVWFGPEINHHLFWDWEAERAKQAVLEYLAPHGAPQGAAP